MFVTNFEISLGIRRFFVAEAPLNDKSGCHPKELLSLSRDFDFVQLTAQWFYHSIAGSRVAERQPGADDHSLGLLIGPQLPLPPAYDKTSLPNALALVLLPCRVPMLNLT